MTSNTDRTSLAYNLHEVLVGLANLNKDWPVYHALAKMFDADDERLFEALRLLRQSIRELKAQVESCQQLQSSRRMHLDNLEAWEALLSAKNFNTPLSKHSALLHEQRLNHLISLNDTLRFWHPQPRLKASTVDTLKKRLDRLSKNVEKSDLQQELKAFVLAQLSNLSWALSNFDFLGMDNVYEVFTGAVARGRSMSGKQAGSPAEREFYRAQRMIASFWGILDKAERLQRGWRAIEGLWAFISGDVPTTLTSLEEPSSSNQLHIFKLPPPDRS